MPRFALWMWAYLLEVAIITVGTVWAVLIWTRGPKPVGPCTYRDRLAYYGACLDLRDAPSGTFAPER
jgi:hypothetical protein